MDANEVQNVYLSTEYCRRKIAESKTKDLPFEQLTEGKSFFIPFGIWEESAVRNMVSGYSARHNRTYRCVKHPEHNCFEVTVIENTEAVDFKIFDCSPLAKQKIGLGGKRIYPFDELPEGKSFLLPVADVNEKSLQVACYREGKRLGRKFVMVKHEQHGLIEVAHVSKQVPEFFNSSPEATGNI